MIRCVVQTNTAGYHFTKELMQNVKLRNRFLSY